MVNSIEVTELTASGLKTYGLDVFSDSGEHCYRNLSCSRYEVENLGSRIKNGNVSEIHLSDIIRDFIVGKTVDLLSENGLI